MPECYTRVQVSEALNASADLVGDELSLGQRDQDLINLLVNAALTLLDDPTTACFDDVIDECYGDSPEEVREWWGGWA